MRSIGAATVTLLVKLKRWRKGADRSRRALAALDDDQLSNLSEIGREIRREEQRAKRHELR